MNNITIPKDQYERILLAMGTSTSYMKSHVKMCESLSSKSREDEDILQKHKDRYDKVVKVLEEAKTLL